MRDNFYKLNENKVETGLYGINIHRSDKLAPSNQIGKWSDGCQVFLTRDKEEDMAICDNFKSTKGNKFLPTH